MRWHWHQLYRMHIICTSLQTDNHASASPLSFFLQAGCSFWCPTNWKTYAQIQEVNGTLNDTHKDGQWVSERFSHTSSPRLSWINGREMGCCWIEAVIPRLHHTCSAPCRVASTISTAGYVWASGPVVSRNFYPSKLPFCVDIWTPI